MDNVIGSLSEGIVLPIMEYIVTTVSSHQGVLIARETQSHQPKQPEQADFNKTPDSVSETLQLQLHNLLFPLLNFSARVLGRLQSTSWSQGSKSMKREKKREGNTLHRANCEERRRNFFCLNNCLSLCTEFSAIWPMQPPQPDYPRRGTRITNEGQGFYFRKKNAKIRSHQPRPDTCTREKEDSIVCFRKD